MTSRLEELSSRLVRPGKLARLGQALWMKIGCAIKKEELVWAQGLLGEDGDALLWDALLQERVIADPDHVIDAPSLARVLGLLSHRPEEDSSLAVVWTLPKSLCDTISTDSYSHAVLQLIENAKHTVTFVSPYIEARGIGSLFDTLLAALKRSVCITVVTHNVEDISSRSSAALGELRREAIGLSGRLVFYSAVREANVLLHSKLVIRDREQAVVGSANLTGAGLDSNLEAGVVLYSEPTAEICRVVDALITSSLVEHVFSIGGNA